MDKAPDFQMLRKEYMRERLDESAIERDPFNQFERWFAEAVKSGIEEPNAMVLATASPSGCPSARAVLLKDFDERGLTFFTNYRSRKGEELAANPRCALLFYWAELERQVRIEGRAQMVERGESEAYFAKRPRGAQIGSAASAQSSVVGSRAALEAEVQRLEAQWEGKEVSCPEHWGGYRVVPERFEFWQGRESRLHDRIVFRLENGFWQIERLAP